MLSILRRVRESAVWIAAAAALAISLGGQLAFAEETKKPPAFKDKWALVVGVSEFSDESLNGSDNRGAANAKSFAEVLTSRLNFAPDHVKVLTDKDANRNDIMLLMCDRWLNQVAGPQDLALIFIATKGTASELDLTGTNYLLAHDSQKEALYASGIAMSGVLSMLRDRLFAKSIVLIVDADHSGALAESTGKRTSFSRSQTKTSLSVKQVLLLSCKKGEDSVSNKKSRLSVFSSRLLEILKSNDKHVNVSKIASHLEKTVCEDARKAIDKSQHPVVIIDPGFEELELGIPPLSPSSVSSKTLSK